MGSVDGADQVPLTVFLVQNDTSYFDIQCIIRLTNFFSKCPYDFFAYMTSIKIVLSEDRKKRIKKASVDAGKTLSRYVLDMVDPLNEDAVRNELTAVEEQLNAVVDLFPT